MVTSPTKSIKHAQKESLFLREITKLIRETAMDNPQINDAFITRVQLSADAGICTVFFYTEQGEEHFKPILEILKLYRPSLRRALASRINARYTPEIIFKFDDKFEQQQRIEQLFEKIKDETQDTPEDDNQQDTQDTIKDDTSK